MTTNKSFYQPITTAGANFITKICTKNGANNNDKLQGNKKTINYIPSILPWSVAPYNDPNYIYTSHAKTGIFGSNNRSPITTNIQLAGEIIKWFNYYCKIYDLNANVLAGQAFIESSYTIWIFNSINATGIGQFIIPTVWDILLNGAFLDILPLFTQDELNVLTKNFVHPLSFYQTFGDKGLHNCIYANDEGKQNRSMLYQNMIDNPDLCIKGMGRKMKLHAENCNHIAASAVACYYQGNYKGNTYVDVLNKIPPQIIDKNGNVRNGRSDAMKYNQTLFDHLKNNFLLAELNQADKSTPDPFAVNVNNS